MARNQINVTQKTPDVSWKDRLGNWGIYAAAAGAALSMATNADAGILTGTLSTTVTIEPQASYNGFSMKSFNVGGASEIARVSNIAAQTIGGTGGPGGLPGFGSCVVPGSPGCVFFQRGAETVPRAAQAMLQSKRHSGSYLKFFDQSGALARNFAAGAMISGSDLHSGAILRTHNGELSLGNFAFGVAGYVGFENQSGDYGWLKVIVNDLNSDQYPDQVEVISYALNTTPGASITAGETSGPSSTPEPGTAAMLLLASGAAGIVALRRARRATA